MGYKKQSKRKSPFKQTAYGSHKGYGVRFDQLEAANVSSNRLGQAVGAIGTTIGDAIQEYKDNKQNEEVADFASLNFKDDVNPDTFDPNSVEWIDENDDISGDLDGIPPSNSSNKPPPAKAGAGSTKTYAQVGADSYQKAINEGKSEEEARGIEKKSIADSKSWNIKEHNTLNPTGNVEGVNNEITFDASQPGNVYQSGSAVPTEGSTAYGSPENSALNRNISPFHRNTALMRSPLFKTAGVPYGELAQSSLTNLSYLGDIGKAGAEGYNSQVDRHNYNQRVKEEQTAELEEEFGELEVPPSGYSNFDASKEITARGWKSQYVQGKKAWKAGKMSNEDWIELKSKLHDNATNYAAGAKNLQESMKNWIENKDKISDSTKPETIDFFNTMEKDPDRLEVQDIDGVATFVGTTLGGKNISIPIDQLASGKAAFRFNTKVDVGKELKPIVDNIQKLKTEMATEFGIGQGNLDFSNEAVQQRVDFGLDDLLSNNAKLRAIASENLGWNHDVFEDRLATDGLDSVTQQVKDQLKGFIEKSYFPAQKTTKFQSDIDLAAQKEARLREQYSQGGSNRGTAGERATADNINIANETLTKDFAYTDPAAYKNLGFETSDFSGLNRADQKTIKKKYNTEDVIIITPPKGGKTLVFPRSTPVDQIRAKVSRSLYGIDPSKLAPLKRISPLRRAWNYIKG